MTRIDPRALRALKNVRTRMRDVAAAAHSIASATRDRSAGELEHEEDTLDTALDEAGETLAGARTVHELAQVGEDTGVHRLAVAEAATRHATAVAALQATAGTLRERARQLRTAERLIERSDRHLADRESRAEQRGADDMASRRR